jgi:uncharacterized protein (DUF885 family)
MRKRFVFLVVLFVVALQAGTAPLEGQTGAGGYDELVAILREARDPQTLGRQPLLSKRMADYSPAGVALRKEKLAGLQRRLQALRMEGWPLAQRVDYYGVRAELDAIDFEQRVLRPWSRDPGLYADMAREVAFTTLPLSGRAREIFPQQLEALPKALEQARANLTEGARELAALALYNLEHADGVGHGHPLRTEPPEGVLGWYRDLLERVARHEPELVAQAREAERAVREYRDWLRKNLPRMAGPAGVGRENYEWYLRRVHFLPHTSDEVVRAGDREYARAMAALALEQNRNRHLPPLQPAASNSEYNRRKDEADARVRRFIAESGFLTLPPDVPRLADNVPWMARPGGRNFWEEIQYRDPLPDKVHAVIPGHRFDLLLHRRDTRPVRGAVQNGSRVEGWGYYLEEAMMSAGLLDDRPRTRELFWIFAAARGVRNRAEVMLHSNEWTVEQAAQFMVESVPFMDANVARVDCEIYLRQPTYGQNYVMGKIEIEDLLAERRRVLGERFSLREFHDQFLAAGLLPVALIRWEMTGDGSRLRALLEGGK